MKKLVAFDLEVYPNYFLAAFKNIKSNKVLYIEIKGADNHLSNKDWKKLKYIITKYTIFGFNSRNYDIPITLYALKGKTASEIFAMSEDIISGEVYGWKTMKKYSLFMPDWLDHFDIQEPSPGVMISLKLYGGRMHFERLQDLPIEPGTILTEQEMIDIRKYCVNDLDTTTELYKSIKPRMDLRISMGKEYGKNLMSKSDAQIAEIVIKSEIKKIFPEKNLIAPKIGGETTFKYKPPKFVSFIGEDTNKVLEIIKNTSFGLDGKGSIALPKELKKLKLKIGYSTYKIGIGGIHTSEKRQTIEPNKHQYLIDRDVSAYYPNIILNLKLYPRHLGIAFLKVYKSIVDKRLEAKRTGNKLVDSSLKITINGSFGKLGNKYSFLYSPDLLLKVTLTGQLSLLMLIERLGDIGINVVSANTDGFVSIVPKNKYNKYNDICEKWEKETSFNLDEIKYKGLYSRDVNNYFAITELGGIKQKGIFTPPGLEKNPAAEIMVIAVEKLLSENIPIRKTILECKDITKFLHVRRVNGGAIWEDHVWGDKYLGKVVRWVYSTDGDKIVYKKPNKKGNHNKVPNSDGAYPMMDLEGLPKHLDYERYIRESISILDDIGFTNF